MALHLLDRAAVALTISGTLQSFIRINASSQIIVGVLGVTITLNNPTFLPPFINPPGSNVYTDISVTAYGTTDTERVFLPDPPDNLATAPVFYDMSGSYTITASVVDVQNGDTGFHLEQRLQPGSTVTVEVVWNAATRISFSVVMPSDLESCAVVNPHFTGSASMSIGSGASKASILIVNATGSATGAGIPAWTWGHARTETYTQYDNDFVPPRPLTHWTFDHTTGAKVQQNYLGIPPATLNNLGGQANTGTANTRESGYALDLKLFTHGSSYPDSMTVKAVYPKSSVITHDTVLLTANPTASHTDSQAGYRISHGVTVIGTVGGVPNQLIFSRGIPLTEKPAITTLRLPLDKNRLRDLGELIHQRVSEEYCEIHGWEFDAFTLTHAASLVLDDGAAVDPANGLWYAETDNNSQAVVSQGAGSIILNGAGVTFNGGVSRNLDFQQGIPGHAYRYARIRFQITAGALTSPFEIWTRSGSKFIQNNSYHWKRWTLEVSALNTWTEQVLDLCMPDSFGSGIFPEGQSFPGPVKSTTPFPQSDPSDSIYPLWDIEDAPYWGISYHDKFRFELSNGQSVEVDYIQAERDDDPVIGMYGGLGFVPENVGQTDTVRPALRSHCDQKVALELWDARLIGDQQLVIRSIAQMAAEVNDPYPRSSSPSRWKGWTAALGSYPAFPSGGYLSSSSPASWVGGGGVIYDGANFNPFKDEAMPAGVLVIPAQAIDQQISWYPGAGDVFGWTDGLRAAIMPIRASHTLRAVVSGLVYDEAGDPVASETVEAWRVDSGEDAGSGITNADAEYQTGLPAMKGDVWHYVRPQTATYEPVEKYAHSHFHHRVVFRLVLQGTGDWISRDRSTAGVHARAYVDGGDIQVGTTTEVLAGDWTDRDTGIAGAKPQIKFDRRGKQQRLWLFYEETGTNLLRARYSLDEGVTWSVANTIFSSGDAHDFVKVSGLRYFYKRTGTAISVKALDDADTVIIPETTVVASGVDAKVISVTEGVVQKGAQYIHLSYWASGNLIEARSRDGINFS